MYTERTGQGCIQEDILVSDVYREKQSVLYIGEEPISAFTGGTIRCRPYTERTSPTCIQREALLAVYRKKGFPPYTEGEFFNHCRIQREAQVKEKT